MNSPHYDPSKYQNMGVFNQSAKKERWDKHVQWHELKPGWNHLRVIGPYFLVAHHWFETLKGKRFSLLVPEFDPFTQDYTNVGTGILDEFGDFKSHPSEKIQKLAPRLSAYVQVIERELQRKGDPWPVKPIRLPITTLSNIRKQAQLNMDANHNIVDVNDINFGCDLMINYDPHGQGADRYSVTLAQNGKVALTDLEKSYFQDSRFIIWENIIQYPTRAELKEALTRNGYYAAAGGAPNAQAQNVANVGIGVPHTPNTVQAPMAPAPAAPQYSAPAAPQYTAPAPAPAPAAPMAPPVTTPQSQYSAPAAPMAPAPAAPAAPMAPQAHYAAPMAPAPAAPMAPAPAAPMAPQAQYAAPVAPAAPQTEGYTLVGRTDKVGKPEFEAAIRKYGEDLTAKGVSRGFNEAGQLKVWDRDDLNGVQVLNCFGSYKGDSDCIRCPLRKQCLIY